MNKFSSKRGSALLIVLGLMGFMMVSAIAFSAYMRFARLPSSYLRRTSSSRQLIKAALARAIDEIDYSIANNPHPGIGTLTTDGTKRNYWKNRIFMGTNEFVNVSETVPVLTLEALAYIPPPLVNEARYFSRLSPAAKWRNFGFDSGRYAFCAIDVSDYFDINRMTAAQARSSADNNRVSMAYLFEDYDHTRAPNGVVAWDEWMKKFRTESANSLGFEYNGIVPLVSMADFNLALHDSGSGTGFKSPICTYLEGGSATGLNTFGGDDEQDKIRNMTFVTDSWFPKKSENSNAGEGNGNNNNSSLQKFDLAQSDGQPFAMGFLNNRNCSVLNIMASAQPAKAHLLSQCCLPTLGLIALYDYLDFDRVPFSLAVPTHEQAPMICGLKPNFNNAQFKLKYGPNSDKIYSAIDNGSLLTADSRTEDTREVFQTVTYLIDAQPFTAGLAAGLETMMVYPFARHDEFTKNDSFTVDGRVSLFLSKSAPAGEEMSLRTGSAEDALHLTEENSLSDMGFQRPGVLSFPYTQLQNQKFAQQTVVEETDVIVSKPILTPAAMQLAPILQATPVFSITYKWEQTWDPENEAYRNPTRPTGAEVVRARCGFPPLLKNGTVDPRYVNDQLMINTLSGGTDTLTLNIALWTRIKNQNNKTVDLVPAHFRDDQVFLQRSNNDNPSAELMCGKEYPLMRFDTGVSIPVSVSGLDALVNQPAQVTVSPAAVMIDDPRFNHAPESWYAASDLSSPQDWLQNNNSLSRNGDIFLSTSDQGYLQSIYELAFLPRFSTFDNFNNVSDSGKRQFDNPITGDHVSPDDGRRTFGAKAEAKNSQFMWSSYRIYGNGNNVDDFETLAEEFSNEGMGYRINPYTDTTNIMMAAFANTPGSWKLASTNDFSEESGLGVGMDLETFNSKYAWNNYSTDYKFQWRDLTGIAGEFMKKISSNRPTMKKDEVPTDRVTPADWRDAWEYLWDDADNDRFGSYPLQNANLWSVDRKFLYSYWKESFADPKQQLFLVFLRSEPQMLGGGDMSKIPPQLSSRAVALVWRDPAKTNATGAGTGGRQGYPHRTRVLFYKPLE